MKYKLSYMSDDESLVVEYDSDEKLLETRGEFFQINCANVPKNKIDLLIEFLNLLKEQSNQNESLITNGQ